MRSAITLVLGILLGVVLAVGTVAALAGLIPAAAEISPSSVPLTAPPPTPTPTPLPVETAEPSGSPAPGSPGPSATPGPGVSASPAGSATAGPSPAFPLVGKAAPALVVPKLGGGTIDLAGLRGKPVWVAFTGTYCPPCRDEYPLMNGFATRYASTGLVVLAVHVREGATTVGPFVSSLNVDFPVGLDADGSKASAWGAVALPFHCFVDAQGIVRDAVIGGIGPDQMARSLATILPGVTVTP
jgi:thiol-disulfide isomerase/thioredoxin